MISTLESVFFKNIRVKTYALIFSVILWAVILGQRSLIITREVPIEYLVSPEARIQDAVDKIKVTIKAKRSVILNFNAESAAPMVDLRNLPPGAKRIPIKLESIAMPIGAKVTAIEPKAVSLFLQVKTSLPQKVDSNEKLVEKSEKNQFEGQK